jgi:3-dehydroquinate dehydratase-2
MKIAYVFNGPNLNLLGTREPAVYGHQTIEDVKILCAQTCLAQGFVLDFRQSNHEGELVDWIQEAGREQQAGRATGVILNAGAYTHTSIALHDAIKGAAVRLIELHISNVHAREPFRHHSFVSPVAWAVMAGFGVTGYAMALSALAQMRESI